MLTSRLGPEVTRVVRALETEHTALDTVPGGPPIPVNDPWVLYASAADKIVALTSMLRRAAIAADPATFWAELYNHANRPSTGLRKAIPATCGLHRGPIGFANLMVSKQGDSVVLDPHVTGEFVITFDTELCQAVQRP